MNTQTGREYFALLRTIYDMARGIPVEMEAAGFPVDEVDLGAAAAKRGIAPDLAGRLAEELVTDGMIQFSRSGFAHLRDKGASLVSLARDMSPEEDSKAEHYPESARLRARRREKQLAALSPREREAVRLGWAWGEEEVAKHRPGAFAPWPGDAAEAGRRVATLLAGQTGDPERLTACCYVSAKEVWQSAADEY